MDVGTQPGGNRLEFSEAWKSIAPMDLRWKQPAWAASTDHRHDEFQPAIPWRVALQQSPPPLRRLSVFCNTPSQFAKSAGININQKRTLLMW
jgi:hypothetical protein